MRTSTLNELESFITKDGSSIRELAGTGWTAARNQSLAEASVPPSGVTERHYHPVSEEIYYFTSGSGEMELDGNRFAVQAGDCVVIPPGTPHQLFAGADVALVLLCMCAPAYTDGDTIIIE